MPSTVPSLRKQKRRGSYLSRELEQFDVGPDVQIPLRGGRSGWIRSPKVLKGIFRNMPSSRAESITVSAHHLRTDFNLSLLLSLMKPRRSPANCQLYLSEISAVIERHHARLMDLPHTALAAVVTRTNRSSLLVKFRRRTDGFYAAEQPLAIQKATSVLAGTILLMPSQRR